MSIMTEGAMSEKDIDRDYVHRNLRLVAFYNFKINYPRRHSSGDDYDSSVEDGHESSLEARYESFREDGNAIPAKDGPENSASLNSGKEMYAPRALFPSTDGDKRRRDRCQEALKAYLRLRLASQCLALCNQIHQKLPRELRDIIYGYILEPRIQHVGPSMFTSPKKKKLCGTRPFFELLEEQDCMEREQRVHHLGHLSDVKFTNTTTRRELSMVYYRITSFSFGSAISAFDSSVTLKQCLDAFLFRTVDPWHIGSSSFDLIRHIQLRYDYRILAQSNRPLTLFHDSRPLLCLPVGVHVSLRVARSWYRYPSEIFALAKGIRKLLLVSTMLQKRGLTVSIDVHEHGERAMEPDFVWDERQDLNEVPGRHLFRLPIESLERSTLEQLIWEAYKKVDLAFTKK